MKWAMLPCSIRIYHVVAAGRARGGCGEGGPFGAGFAWGGKEKGGDTREEEVSPPKNRKPREEEGSSELVPRLVALAGRAGGMGCGGLREEEEAAA